MAQATYYTRNWGSVPGTGKGFPLPHIICTCPGGQTSFVQWLPGPLPWVKVAIAMKLTTYLHLVPRLRMCGAVPSFLIYIYDMI
jgi:hypothetical protein